jgi:hypothetical protein
MEGQQDQNRKTPQIPQGQTGSGVADWLDRTPIGSRGGAALAWFIAARRFDPREATASDRLTEPESLTREWIDAPRQER